MSHMKSVIGKSLCDELWDRLRFDHILKIVWTKICNKNMYGKMGKISGQPSSHTQFDSNHMIAA